MKKLLILGGARAQIPAILRAKELGYYTITCDYLPENPGHFYSDKYVNISTIDKIEVLEFARKEKVDGVIAYASDPSAPTAAYICDELHLPGASYQVTRVLCEKDLFRRFQKENGCLTPWFFGIKSNRDFEDMRDRIKFPCVVKPVDLSGSKGVRTIYKREELDRAVSEAIELSRCKRAIVEQYIESSHDQLHGDGIVVDGELQFLVLGDQRFRNSVPIGTSVPSSIDLGSMEKVVNDVKSMIRISGFRCGAINVEARVSNSGEIYIIEIGPRTGGNYIPQLMQLSTGYDEVTASLKLAMGENCDSYCRGKISYCFQYIVGSEQKGRFQYIYIDEYIKKKIVKQYIHKTKGDAIEEYENSSGVVGVILLKFDSMEEMEEDIKNIKEHVKVKLEEESDV